MRRRGKEGQVRSHASRGVTHASREVTHASRGVADASRGVDDGGSLRKVGPGTLVEVI